MKKKILFLIPLLLSCSELTTSSSEFLSSLSNDTSFTTETSSSESFKESSSSESGTSNPFEGFYELEKDIYVNYLPNIYQNSLDLQFKVNNPNYEIYYSFDGSKPNYKYQYPIIIDSKKITSLTQIPFTTSVDGILKDDYEGKCVSENYNNNIQRNKNYYLKMDKQPVLTIRVYDTKTKQDVLSRSLTYIIDKDNYFSIPVVSLSLPYEEMFGNNGFYNKIREEIEKRVNLEYIDPVYEEYFYRNSQVKLGGNWSLGYPQRTLNLNFNKNEFGKKNQKVDAHIFKDRTKKDGSLLTGFTRFRLHNGGNCFESFTGFNDALLQEVMVNSNASTTGYRPCIVYINGEYFGLYSIREHYKDTYFEMNYNVKKDDVIMYKYKGDFLLDEGNDESFLQEMMHFLNQDLANNNIYNEFCEKYIDIDSFIDVVLANAYASNWDFVGNNNNLIMWRTSVVKDKKYYDGKFRFALHDADFAFSEDTNFLSRKQLHSYSNFKLLKCLMINYEFKQTFYKRAKYLLNNNLNIDNIYQKLLEMVEEVLPYKYDQCLRWGQQSDCLDNWEKQIENTKKIISLRNDKFLNEVKNYLNEF